MNEESIPLNCSFNIGDASDDGSSFSSFQQEKKKTKPEATTMVVVGLSVAGVAALLVLLVMFITTANDTSSLATTTTTSSSARSPYEPVRGFIREGSTNTNTATGAGQERSSYHGMGKVVVSSKSDKKNDKKMKKASVRIVETIDPTDPNGTGDIILSLGFNPLTQALSLVGSNFVTNGSVFKTHDIKVVDGEIIGTIPFGKQIGDSSSTCTITKGTFKPEENIVFIESATCNYSTCFPKGPVEPSKGEVEQCFFGISGGTLNINAAQLIFGEMINGILLGGTFGFEGLQGSFVVNKIVQGQFPPPSPPTIQYNVFQIDFEFTAIDDDFDLYPNPFE